MNRVMLKGIDNLKLAYVFLLHAAELNGKRSPPGDFGATARNGIAACLEELGERYRANPACAEASPMGEIINALGGVEDLGDAKAVAMAVREIDIPFQPRRPAADRAVPENPFRRGPA